MCNKHVLTSKIHQFSQRDRWWYAIPPLGNKYRSGDSIEFRMEDFDTGKAGIFSIRLEGIWLERVTTSSTDRRGYVHVHIWRSIGGKDCKICFGSRDRGKYLIDVELE